MPIQLASYLVTKPDGQYYLMEDILFKGGFRTLADTAAQSIQLFSFVDTPDSSTVGSTSMLARNMWSTTTMLPAAHGNSAYTFSAKDMKAGLTITRT